MQAFQWHFSTAFVAIPVTTNVAQNTNVVASYYSNIAQGYDDYGFVYSFSSTVVDRGMKSRRTTISRMWKM